MAEIGVVASIVGLAGAGIQVSFALFDLADRIGSAGEEVKLVATELSLFNSVLQEVASVIQDGDASQLTPAALSLVDGVTSRCREVVTEIDKIVSSLTKDQNPFDLPKLEWISRVKWTFKRSKVQVQRQTLESCKSTLQLLLTTLRWSRRYSTHTTETTQREADQYQLVTQGLVLAVRSAVSQLRDLEDQAEHEKDTDDHPAQKDSLRLSHLFDGLSTRTRSPLPHPTPMIRRTSTWLDKLIFDEQSPVDPHPGERHYRFSSATTANDPFVLLQKWTEARPRRYFNVDEGEPKPAFNEASFTNAATELSKADIARPTMSRIATSGPSPKSTLAVKLPQKPLVTAINLPQTIEMVEEDWMNVTYERWMSLTLNNIGLRYEPAIYELVVAYGGNERVILPTDKPYCIFEDLMRYQLRPRFLLCKKAQSKMTITQSAIAVDEPLTTSPVMISAIDTKVEAHRLST